MIAEMARQLFPHVLNSMQTLWHYGFSFANHNWGQYFQYGQQYGSGQYGRGNNYYGQYGQYGQYGRGNNYYGQYGKGQGRHW